RRQPFADVVRRRRSQTPVRRRLFADALTPACEGDRVPADPMFISDGGVMTQRLTITLSACLMAMCFFSMCFFSMNEASAQVNTADILGTVSDPGGAVIPGVKITAQNIATNEIKTVTTSSTGDYVFN